MPVPIDARAGPEIDIASIFRQEHGRVFGALVRQLNDFDRAEDAIQEAFLVALQLWPRQGAPHKPAAWITTVARNAALSAHRHQSLAAQKHAALAQEAQALAAAGAAAWDEDIPDERLRLIFTCCHPALSEEARVALTLQTMCGVPTAEIARLFLAREDAMAQRLVRAKRRIKETGIPFAIPAAERLEERVEAVCSVVYLTFTAGFSSAGPEAPVRSELCAEAIHLGRVLVHLMPSEPEVRGLLALMLLHDARRAARVDPAGELVPLEAQDRARWDQAAIVEGTRLLDEAIARGRPGPFQIQAAIAALHAQAKDSASTPWGEIRALYDELYRRVPSPAVAVGLCVAEGMANGAEAGLARLDRLAPELEGYGRTAAARADLLRRAGRIQEAIAAYRVAIAECPSPWEAQALRRRAEALERPSST